MKRSRVRGKRRRVRSQQLAGTIVRCLAFLVVLAGCVLGVQWVRDGVHRSGMLDGPPAGPSLTILAGLPHQPIQIRNQRPVYPYSVIPGGVRSGAELRDVAAHDPVVAQHYTGFDYKRARILEVRQPQLVYLSYRRGKHVYWTRKQATLHTGEKLLTDGQITARTRCGNQVSALPRAETSAEEPSMAELDRPDALASGMEQPLTLASNSLQVDPGLPLGPSSPGGGFAGGPGVTVPPAIAGGGVVPPVGGNCPPKGTATNCNHQPPPTPPPQPPPPTPVPEPASLVLMVSGATAIYMRVRSHRS